MNKIEHQNLHFESISHRYYAARQNKKHLLYKSLLFDFLLSHLREKFASSKTLLVLEPMCGYAEGKAIVENNISQNIYYEGFDYNDTLIANVRKTHPEINIFKQDVTTFQTEKKYDIIILIGGLHHVHACALKIVETLADALNPDGFFINFEPTHNNFLVALVRSIIYKKNDLFDETTEHDFSLQNINNIYTQSGFKIYKQYYPGILGYILFYNPDAFPLLNIGNMRLVRTVFHLEKRLYTSWFGKKLSFATFSILKKMDPDSGLS